jgi:hypothetical protein
MVLIENLILICRETLRHSLLSLQSQASYQYIGGKNVEYLGGFHKIELVDA